VGDAAIQEENACESDNSYIQTNRAGLASDEAELLKQIDATLFSHTPGTSRRDMV